MPTSEQRCAFWRQNLIIGDVSMMLVEGRTSRTNSVGQDQAGSRITERERDGSILGLKVTFPQRIDICASLRVIEVRMSRSVGPLMRREGVDCIITLCTTIRSFRRRTFATSEPATLQTTTHPIARPTLSSNEPARRQNAWADSLIAPPTNESDSSEDSGKAEKWRSHHAPASPCPRRCAPS